MENRAVLYGPRSRNGDCGKSRLLMNHAGHQTSAAVAYLYQQCMRLARLNCRDNTR